MENKILEIRKSIDIVDDKINVLLAQRAELVIAMKRAKGGAKIYRPSREAEIIKRVVAKNAGEYPDATIRAIFTEIVSGGRNLEQKLKVGYLGPEGSYSHEAAAKLLGSQSDLIAFGSLADVFAAGQKSVVDVVVMPIQNSSEGSVVETIKMLADTNLQIVGEITLPINHCLITKATDLKNISKICAHPQALGQCRKWLQINLPNVTTEPVSSNSAAVDMAKQNVNIAAIASQRAADIYDMPILKHNIQDVVDNNTRFVALGSAETQPSDNDKTSLICVAQNKPGALYELLGVFQAYGINLLSLSSHPRAGGDYDFYIDFDGHIATKNVGSMLEKLITVALSCKILGSYPKEK